MAYCIVCGNKNPINANFCEKCGSKIMPNLCTNEICENHIQSIPLSQKALYCNACGSKTTRGAIKKPEEPIDTDTWIDNPMFEQAVNMALDFGEVSTSGIQRRLRLGYAKAGRIVDQMEQLGIISEPNGSSPRQVLITREQWQQMKQ